MPSNKNQAPNLQLNKIVFQLEATRRIKSHGLEVESSA